MQEDQEQSTMQPGAVISREQALKEVESWLDYKKIPHTDRAKKKEQIENLVAAIEDGRLIKEENNVWKQKLLFPITTGEKPIEELKYQPRIMQETINLRTKNVQPGDLDGRIKAYAAAITRTVDGIIGKLDSVDLSLCESIVNFFM
jgi:hypothetical protein